MNLTGRWILRNGMIAAVHINPAATEGDKVERYLGHLIPVEIAIGQRYFSVICWNENGECVWVQGTVNDTKNYDLMECINGKDRVESKMKEPINSLTCKIVGCKECEE